MVIKTKFRILFSFKVGSWWNRRNLFLLLISFSLNSDDLNILNSKYLQSPIEIDFEIKRTQLMYF